MKKYIGSTIALIIGILSLLSGLAYLNSGLNTGPIIILGALAYKSAKKRKLGIVKSSSYRIIFEVISICIILAAILFQKNLTYHIATDPVPNFIIPLWAIIAYLIIVFKREKEQGSIKEISG